MWTRLCRRGLAAAAKGRGKKSVLDLGWDKLTAPLEATDLQLPALKSLRVLHPKIGTGHAGARKFKALLPALRWQNPEAAIDMRWDEGAPASRVAIELADGGALELDVTGQRSEAILGEVLRAAGADDDRIAPSVEWAAEFLKGRPISSKPHLMWRESPDAPALAEDVNGGRLLPDDDAPYDADGVEDEYFADVEDPASLPGQSK